MRLWKKQYVVILALLIAAGMASVFFRESRVAADVPVAATQPKDQGSGVETIVFLRHGEKPSHGLGQLTPQGLNRAIALSTVLPEKFGKPDFLFAPDPQEKTTEGGGQFNYIRPLMTIEPTAIRLEMPVQTPCGFREIDKLNEELTKPQYAGSLIFVAWEHVVEKKAVANLVKMFGGDASEVPDWPGQDFDSLYVVKITRVAGQQPTVVFTHEHEGLDGQSKTMPVAAAK